MYRNSAAKDRGFRDGSIARRDLQVSALNCLSGKEMEFLCSSMPARIQPLQESNDFPGKLRHPYQSNSLSLSYSWIQTAGGRFAEKLIAGRLPVNESLRLNDYHRRRS